MLDTFGHDLLREGAGVLGGQALPLLLLLAATCCCYMLLLHAAVCCRWLHGSCSCGPCCLLLPTPLPMASPPRVPPRPCFCLADVAGGKGELAFELLNLSGIPATVLEPRPLDLQKRIKWLQVTPHLGSRIAVCENCMSVRACVAYLCRGLCHGDLQICSPLLT